MALASKARRIRRWSPIFSTASLAGGAIPVTAVKSALSRLRGAFALAILFAGREDLMIGARRGSPLAVGYGRGEMFLGSDAMALAPFTDRVTFLEEGDWAVLSHDGALIFDENGGQASRPITRTAASALLIDKGNHRHFMAKEIHEQPEVISRTLAHYVRFADNAIALPGRELPFEKLSQAHHHRLRDSLLCRAHGEILVRALREAARGRRYRVRIPLSRGAAAQGRPRCVRIAVGRNRRHAGEPSLLPREWPAYRVRGECAESSIARESDVVLPTLAGPEIGVASTKAFTCQLSVLACMAIAAGRKRGALSAAEEGELVRALIQAPRLITEVLAPRG